MHPFETLRNLDVLPASVVETDAVAYGLIRHAGKIRLVAIADKSSEGVLETFEGASTEHEGQVLFVGPANTRNAGALRTRIPRLAASTVGIRTSAGFGDRLGLATPGHIRALRSAGAGIAPVFAQQSMREMARANRTPGEVLDDALWGVMAEGWDQGYGSDADHLKTADDVRTCVNAGFTGFTLDPGDHVDDRAVSTPPKALRDMAELLPWDRLEDTLPDFFRRYQNKTFRLDRGAIRPEVAELARALVKYGKAVAHVALLARLLAEAMQERAFDLEISVDETETPTSPVEHLVVASELKRLGVTWTGLAPRFLGRFEKGVDYIGDVPTFRKDFSLHASIARALGPYKLSLHSGSDKFGVYSVVAEETRGLVHLKTAGTSYLEALRTAASTDPVFFRAVYAFARERYEQDRSSYHVSARLDAAPDPEALDDADLPSLLERFDARQILHVTFGSVLTDRGSDGRPRFRDRLFELLREHREAYAGNLKSHFLRHLQPFTGTHPGSVQGSLF
jgi:hypothetical protein